jgi:hypothetical protein
LGVKLCHDFFEGVAVVQFAYYFLDLVGDGGCDAGHDEGRVLGGTRRAELEFVARVGVWAGPVAVRVLLVQVVGYVWQVLFEVFYVRAFPVVDHVGYCTS